MNPVSLNGVFVLLTHILFIYVTFWALKAIRIENWIRKNHVNEARVLYALLAIAIGYTVSSFFIAFIETSLNISFGLFQ